LVGLADGADDGLGVGSDDGRADGLTDGVSVGDSEHKSSESHGTISRHEQEFWS